MYLYDSFYFYSIFFLLKDKLNGERYNYYFYCVDFNVSGIRNNLKYVESD